MKIKLLVLLSLALLTGLAGCRGDSNANANIKSNATATPTAIVKTTETPATDMATKTKIEDALKKKGFNNVTVDNTTKPITLRGTYPKGKLDEVIATAQEAAGTSVKNEMAEAK